MNRYLPGPVVVAWNDDESTRCSRDRISYGWWVQWTKRDLPEGKEGVSITVNGHVAGRLDNWKYIYLEEANSTETQITED
ncbi:hypothetical protein AAF712_011266 [Marasmius tenuissimus]|uniref:Uncharacterized protein n=1 Tax=Marasmius tenuissimus TaxID=585030 RepID=A0ABR2ZJQ9_9AGAR